MFRGPSRKVRPPEVYGAPSAECPERPPVALSEAASVRIGRHNWRTSVLCGVRHEELSRRPPTCFRPGLSFGHCVEYSSEIAR